MILKKIILENFRPYYGINEIELCSGEKNVTLLKAENGSGKTTLLEGIRWCLYGQELNLTCGNPRTHGMTSFINKKRISEMVNENDEVKAAVEIEFTEGNKSYILKRIIKFQNKKHSIELELLEDGTKLSNRNDEIENKIRSIIPEEIDFFINGERLERIVPKELSISAVKKQSQAEIKESIFRILGIKSLENAVADMEEICKEFSKEYLKDGNLTDKEKIIYKNLQEQEDELKDKKNRLENITKEIASIEKLIERHKISLQSLPQKYELEDEIESKLIELEKNKLYLEKTYNDLKKEYKKVLATKSWKIISKDIILKGFSLLEEKKEFGVIPTKYEKEFLEELLTIKKCICGSNLCEESENFKEIVKRLDGAGTRKHREIFNECFFEIKNIKNKINSDEVNKKIDELKEKKIFDFENIIFIEKEIEYLTKSIDKDLAEQRKLIIKEIEEKEEENKELYLKKGSLMSSIENLGPKVNSLVKEKVEIEKKQISKESVREKKLFAEKILESLKILKSKKEETGRNELGLKIAEVYSKVNGKNYKIEIDEEFKFEVYDHDGTKMGISTGEDKNKALSFIGGLVYYAKELKSKNKENEFEGGIYPLVMDAPYGDLDNMYRKEFTKFLPEISEQVIVMVSSGQWNEEVQSVIENRIGNMYSLVNMRRGNDEVMFDMTEIRREKEWNIQ